MEEDMGEERLTDEQQRIFDAVVKEGKNVFFTGPGKCGKTIILQAIIQALCEAGHSDSLTITAPVWVAARNLDNDCITVSGFSGVNSNNAHNSAIDIANALKPDVLSRLQQTKILIIDDISLVSASIFDKMDSVVRLVKHSNLPFGGIQLIVTGDFFSYGPLSNGWSMKKTTAKDQQYAFESDAWDRVFDRQLKLQEQLYGSPVDNLLACIRQGVLDKAGSDAVNELRDSSLYDQSPRSFTQLYASDEQAAVANELFQETQLFGEEQGFDAIDNPAPPEGNPVKPDNDAPPNRIVLKTGAVVEMIKDSSGLERGVIGEVVGFHDNAEHLPKIRIAGSDDLITVERITFKIWLDKNGRRKPYLRKQLPLVLVMAKEVIKVAGLELSNVKVDASSFLNAGTLYAALTRALYEQKGSLVLTEFDWKVARPHDKVIKFYHALQTA